MGGRWGRLVLLMAMSLLPASLLAQGQAPGQGAGVGSLGQLGGLNQIPGMGVQQGMPLWGKVMNSQGDPLNHATVEVLNNAGVQSRVLLTDAEGKFNTEIMLFNSDGFSVGDHGPSDVRNFTVCLRISKKGFQATHRIGVLQSEKDLGLLIRLLPTQKEDPALLSPADLIKGLAPRLRQLGPGDGLSAKDAKDYAHAVQDFLDHNHMEQAVPRFVKVARRNPSCLKCRTMLALAELGWGDEEDAQRELGESVNALITDRNLASAEPLLAFGVLISWRRDPEKAGAYIYEALKYAPSNALALQEMGREQCLDMDWQSGSESLKKALAADAGPQARLLYAESLLHVGTPREASDELNHYMDGREFKSMPPEARSLWVNIQQRESDDEAIRAAKLAAQTRGIAPLDYLHNPPKNLADFEPATDQAPLAAILAAVGKNVSDLFANLPNICSVEKVHQEILRRNGKAASAREHKYRYLLLTPDQRWGPTVEEYRADTQGQVTPQTEPSDSYMLTSGFVSAPLIFHPAYQRGSTFRLLGRQKVKGRDTYLIAYAQEPAKTRFSGRFMMGSEGTTTYTQGIAWIDAESYQITRISTDLLNPLPQVKLMKESTEINFSQVHFKRPAQAFWLPDVVTVTLDWNGKILRNQHAYSEFLLSNVDSTQTIKNPKVPEKTVEETTEETTDPAPNNDPQRSPSLSLVPPK